jgi:hypothetical protein
VQRAAARAFAASPLSASRSGAMSITGTLAPGAILIALESSSCQWSGRLRKLKN